MKIPQNFNTNLFNLTHFFENVKLILGYITSHLQHRIYLDIFDYFPNFTRRNAYSPHYLIRD